MEGRVLVRKCTHGRRTSDTLPSPFFPTGCTGRPKVMHQTVSWILDVEISAGQQAEFRSLMAEMVAATQAKEPGTLHYEWSTTANGSHGQIYERYRDSDAVMAHLTNFGTHFAERFLQIMRPTRLVVFGAPSPAVRAALESLDPVYMERAAGFAR